MASSSLAIPEAHQEPPSEEAMPLQLPEPLLDIMTAYLEDDIQVPSSVFESGRRFTIFESDVVRRIYQKAMIIARDYVLPAAPLDLLEAAVEKTPAVLLPTLRINGMKGTLHELAIIGLDVTIRSVRGLEDEGMADRLLRLRQKFLPETMAEAFTQAQHAAFIEEKDGASKAKQLAVLNEAFYRVKDEKPSADSVVADYLKSIKPVEMINNSYYLNLLQFLYRAFSFIAVRDYEFDRRLYYTHSSRFCIEVIGTAIERELPPRVRQIVMSGLSQFLHQGTIEKRFIDRGGLRFRCGANNEFLLGFNCFYAAEGIISERHRMNAEPTAVLFKKYFEQLRGRPTRSQCLVM